MTDRRDRLATREDPDPSEDRTAALFGLTIVYVLHEGVMNFSRSTRTVDLEALLKILLFAVSSYDCACFLPFFFNFCPSDVANDCDVNICV